MVHNGDYKEYPRPFCPDQPPHPEKNYAFVFPDYFQ